jgi:hypothetical protein
MEGKRLLGYWRASLADAALPSLPRKVSRYPVEWSAVTGGRIARATADGIFRDHPPSRDEQPDRLPVLLAPLVFTARHRHGTTGRPGRDENLLAPLIVAIWVDRLGRLHPGGTLPWFARDVLEPSASSHPSLGKLDDFDLFRSTEPPPGEGGWPELIRYVEALCLAVTGQVLGEVAVEGYERTTPAIVHGKPPVSPANHLIAFADQLLSGDEELPATFRSLCHPGPLRAPLSTEERRKLSRRHLGQMGREFPLADRQRDAIHHLLACGDGEILPVNGPPGTGKTTLLQSVVATWMTKAAIDGGKAPVIFVSSTNNQAVTNVINSFSTADAGDGDPLGGRWIPDVSSLALYLPSAGVNDEERKRHQIAWLPRYQTPLSGFPAELLGRDRVNKAEKAYLASAAKGLGKPFNTVSEVREALSRGLREREGALNDVLDRADAVLLARAAHPGMAPEGQETHLGALATLRSQVGKAEERLRRSEEAADAAIDELFPGRGLLGTLLSWATGLIPTVRAQRWDRCRRALRGWELEDILPSGDASPDFAPIRSALRNAIDEARREALATRQAAEEWQAAETAWRKTAQELVEMGKGNRYLADLSADDLVSRPGRAEAVLDLTLRHHLFRLAVHYWEARWLEEAARLIADNDDPVKALSDDRETPSMGRWRFLAQLTPCFVSTLFMLPKHLSVYAPDGKSSRRSLVDFVDLLIVDEAGQVAPEVGGIGLALGRRALVVGDVHQIEPVWSVGRQTDDGNVVRYELEPHADALDRSGARAMNGSLMRLARHAGAFLGGDGEPGIFLNEHRRCQPPIIQVCNEMVYRGRLLPRTPDTERPVFPPLGWANVRSSSERRGTSLANPGEAEAIAEWLGRRAAEIVARHGQPIEKVVAVVTPYVAQKAAIKAALGRHGIDGETMTVGTVHALQGAEREIVVFSPVYTGDDSGRAFFDQGPNMLNVAISRAKGSFLVFGDMRVFDPRDAESGFPSGFLARHLMARPEYEILDALARPEFLQGRDGGGCDHIEGLLAHREILREGIETARKRVLIVSPYLSVSALTEDDVETMVRSARRRGVEVTVGFDPELNSPGGKLKDGCLEAVERLKGAGAEVVELRRNHCKTLAVDGTWIVEGSFNWLSALRDPDHRFARSERSLRVRGMEAAVFVETAWKEIRNT